MIYWLAVVISLLHIGVNALSLFDEIWRNSLHWGLLGALAFLVYPTMLKKASLQINLAIDVLLSILSIAITSYFLWLQPILQAQSPRFIILDLVVAALAFLMLLELARRTSGIFLPVLAIGSISYLLVWGRFLPGRLHFSGASLSEVLKYLYFTNQGLFSTTAATSSSWLFMFVILAAFIREAGADVLIKNLIQNLSVKQNFWSGIFAANYSTLLGAFSGSAIANITSTEYLTTPLLKQKGFPAPLAAGVNVVASVGGQLMPPVMGAGVLVMSQTAQLSVPAIVGAAFLPAIMYLLAVFFGIYQNSNKISIEGDEDEIVSNSINWREYILFVPTLVILVFLLIFDVKVTYTVVAAIAGLVISSRFTQEHRLSTKNVFNALAIGANNMLATGIALIAIGMFTSVLGFNQINITFSDLLISLTGNNLIIILIVISLTALVLGRSLPAIAAYIVLAILVIPSLEKLGFSAIKAHMIVFWLAQISHITPPVCLTAGAAAEIAQTQRLETTLEALKLGFSLYLIPILFAYTALTDGSLWQKIDVFLFGLVGLYLFSGVISGYLFRSINVFERIIFCAMAPLLFLPDFRLKVLGIFLTLIAYFYQTRIADK